MEINKLAGEQIKKDMLKTSLSCGDVFLGEFKNISHPKFFVIAGLSSNKMFICSVFVNSNIPDSIFRNEGLLNLQVPVKAAKYAFLKYDSFVSCNKQIKLEFQNIYNAINNKKCKYIGKLDEDDLCNIRTTLINSGLLTEGEIELYF